MAVYNSKMSLELGLQSEQLQKLRDEVEKDKEFIELKEKMRAAVLLCTQELMNNAKKSAFEQFHRELPQVDNIEEAIGMAAKWLQSKNLVHTLTVLRDEVDPGELEEAMAKAATPLDELA